MKISFVLRVSEKEYLLYLTLSYFLLVIRMVNLLKYIEEKMCKLISSCRLGILSIFYQRKSFKEREPKGLTVDLFPY